MPLLYFQLSWTCVSIQSSSHSANQQNGLMLLLSEAYRTNTLGPLCLLLVWTSKRNFHVLLFFFSVASEKIQFYWFIVAFSSGNGYIGTAATSRSKLHVKTTRTLSVEVNYYPVVHVNIEGLSSQGEKHFRRACGTTVKPGLFSNSAMFYLWNPPFPPPLVLCQLAELIDFSKNFSQWASGWQCLLFLASFCRGHGVGLRGWARVQNSVLSVGQFYIRTFCFCIVEKYLKRFNTWEDKLWRCFSARVTMTMASLKKTTLPSEERNCVFSQHFWANFKNSVQQTPPRPPDVSRRATT